MIDRRSAADARRLAAGDRQPDLERDQVQQCRRHGRSIDHEGDVGHVRLDRRRQWHRHPADEVGDVFSRFFRSSTAAQAAIAGTGLGLSITRALVEQHGGTISLESVEGRGTTVTVRCRHLPAAGTIAGMRRTLFLVAAVASLLWAVGTSAQAPSSPRGARVARSSRRRTRGTSASTRCPSRRTRAADRVDGSVDGPAPRLRLRPLRRAADRHPVRRRDEEDAALARHVRLRRRIGQGPDTRFRRRCTSRADARPTATGTRSCSTGTRAKLYELYALYPQPAAAGRQDRARSGTSRSNALRPAGWTSADAAGLPIFPGLARYDEVARGTIDHAMRFTVCRARAAHTSIPRVTTRRAPTTRRCRRMGDARPAEVERRHLRLSAAGAHRAPGAEDVRDDRRRQRLELVHHRCARPALVERRAARARRHQGLRLRGRRHVLAARTRLNAELWPRSSSATFAAREAAHAVHAAAGRSRRAAEVDARERSAVRVARGDRSCSELAEVHRPAVQVAADEVAVVRLEVGRAARAPREDAARGSPARSARPAPRSHRSCRPSIRSGRGSTPSRCAFPRARACRPTGSAARAARTAAPRRAALRLDDLRERTAEMHRRRAGTALVAPRDRARQRPVELERTGSVPEPAEALA